jgi:TP901 family phage tail tape measure protein
MGDRSVSVNLKAEITGYVANIQKASMVTKDFANDAQKSAAKHGQAWEKVGSGMLITGGALAAGVGLAAKSYMDFDASMSKVAAGTMATGKSLDALRTAAVDAGAKTQYSAVEAADAITAMGKAGVSTRDILGGGLTGALSLAAAGQLDVASASEIAATAMNQFGLEGKDIPHIADLLAAGAGKAMGSVTDLAGALKYVGPVAKGLDVSIEQTTGVLAEFAQQGILGEQAGTSMRGMLLTLTSPSGVVAKKMEELGINVYDASGKFIGLDGAAGELQAKLGPLDDATRNAALGQIFGNEQVTAARILYEGGAGAVHEWTAKVNDAGFASRQAAQLTDNLKGDVERLGGSLSSVLIVSGSGTNGMLRTMTQELQGAVDLYGSMPTPVQQTATVLGAVAGAASLVVGGLITLAPRIIATKAALADMGRTGELLSSGIGKAATAGKMLGGPLVIGAVLLGVFAKQAQESKARVDELATSLDAQTGALTENTTATVNKTLSDDGTLEMAKRMGIAAGDVTSAYLGNAAALARVKSATEDWAAAGQANGDQLTENATDANGLMSAISGGNDELSKATEKTKLLAEANAAAIDPTTGLSGAQKSAAAATKAAGDAADAAKVPTKEQTDAETALTKAAEEAKKAHDALKDSITGYGSAMMAARGDARSYEAAIDAATDAVKKNGKTAVDHGRSLQIDTETGRDNQAALDAISTAALKSAESKLTASEANGTLAKTSQAVTGDIDKARTAFINSAVSMGMNKKAAGELADQQGLTSGRVKGLTDQLITLDAQKANPTIDLDPAAAKAKITDLQGKITAIKQGKVPGVNADTAEGKRKIAELQAQIDALKPKTIKITTEHIATGKGPGGSGGQWAGGGLLSGPGTGTSDSIPIMGSDGEYIVRASSVAKPGVRAHLDQINSYADGGLVGAKQAIVRGYASGGPVAASFSRPVPAPAWGSQSGARSAPVVNVATEVYVQNPFTGAYLLAQVSSVVDGHTQGLVDALVYGGGA